MDAASSKAEKQFPQWKSDLDWGWSLMFYGVGSKREVGGRVLRVYDPIVVVEFVVALVGIGGVSRPAIFVCPSRSVVARVARVFGRTCR